MAQTFTGVVERIELVRGPHPDPYIGRYSPNNEYYQLRAKGALRLADGAFVYFQGPAVDMSVANSPVASIVLYDIGREAAHWYQEVGEGRVATTAKANGNRLELLIQAGQTVTIRGTVKTDTVSKRGNRYRVVNRVKLLPAVVTA